MDPTTASHPPPHILGYSIRSRTRIYVSYILPTSLALFVYIVQTSADLALSGQYFRTKDVGFAVGTLLLVLIPAILTFILVLSLPAQRESATEQGQGRGKFYAYHLLQLLLFPFFVVYRFTLRVFWGVEALFHDDDDVERMKCLAKARQTSTIELYLFTQAYAQAAPQIILQLYHMLAQDMYRNYETTGVQAICLIFSAINLACITTTYHRIESQRCVGRHYPWATKQQVREHQCLLEQNERLCGAAQLQKRESERSITKFPESEKIMANFHAQHGDDSKEGSHELVFEGEDEVDNDTATSVQLHTHTAAPKTAGNATDDDKIQNSKPKLKLRHDDLGDLDIIEVLVDAVPESPAPRPPPATAPAELPALPINMLDMPTPATDLRRTMSDNRKSQRMTRPLSQLETFKEMLLINAQLYIKEHVPRPPKLLIGRLEGQESKDEEQTPLVTAPLNDSSSPKDVVDFYFPQPAKVVNGIGQEDFAATTVAFFGWIAFVIMRMLSLATFCIFYPQAFFIILSVHYVLMLIGLGLETRFRGNCSSKLFYLLLAYIYIFVLLEFRVCFKRIRIWYGCYLVLTLVENITMSAVWYGNADFESWWFGFIWQWIIWSGALFLATILVYYCILRPKEVSLIVEGDTQKSTEPEPTTPGSIKVVA